VFEIQLTLHRYTSAQFILFLIKQGYIFRLEVSHLKVPKTFSLPDVLSNGQSNW